MVRNPGFTLLELMIAMSILAVVSLLAFVAVASSAESASAADAQSIVQQNVRDAITAMTREIQLSAKQGDDSLIPVLQPLQVNANPTANSPIEVVFQVPRDGSGRLWTNPIRFRYITEDANNNALLDAGEDGDGDGELARRIVRLEDRNGDGDTLDAGEQSTVAGANDLSNVQFAINGDVLQITLSATKLFGRRRTNPATATATTRLYLLN